MAVGREQIGIEIVARDLAEAAFESVKRHIGGIDTVTRDSLGTLKSWSDQWKTAGSMLRQQGFDLSKYVTAPLVGVGAAALKSGIDYDSAMKTIKVGTLATGNELAGLERSFQNVGRQVPQDMGTVAQAVTDVHTRLGLTGRELDDSTVRFLNYARVHRMDVGEAIRDVTRLMNGMGLEASQLPVVLDRLTTGAALSGASVGDLARWVNEAGPSFEAFGFDLERSIALFGTFEREGAKPQEVLSSLNIAFMRLAREGFTDPQAAWDELIRRIREAPNDFEAARIAGDAFGDRVGGKIAEDIRSGKFAVDEMAQAIRDSGPVMDRLGDDTLSLGDRVATGFNRLLIGAGSAMRDELPRIGQIIENVFDQAERAIMGVIEWWKSLDDETKTWIVTIGLIVAAVGPVLVVLGLMASAIGSILGVIHLFAVGALKLGGALVTIGQYAVAGAIGLGKMAVAVVTAIPAILAKAAAWAAVAVAVIAANLPLILLVTAIGLVVVAIVWLLDQLGLLQPLLDLVGEAFHKMGEIIASVPDMVREAFFGLLDFIGSIVGGIIGGLGELIGFFEFLPGPLGESAAQMREDLKRVEEDFSNLGTTTRQAMDEAANSTEAGAARQAEALARIEAKNAEVGESTVQMANGFVISNEQAGNSVTDMVGGVLTDLGLLPPGMDGVGLSAEQMAAITGGASADMLADLGMLPDGFDDVGTAAGEAETRVKASLEQITGALGGLGSSADAAWDQFKAAAEDGTQDPQERIDELRARIDELNNEDLASLGPAALARWAEAKQATEQELGGLVHFVDNQGAIISTLLPDAMRDSNAAWGQEWGNIFDMTGRYGDQLHGLMHGSADGARAGFMGPLNNIPPELSGVFATATGQVQMGTGAITGAFDSGLSPIPGMAGQYGQLGGQGLVANLNGFIAPAGQAASGMTTAFGNGLTPLPGMAGQYGTQGGQMLTSNLNGFVPQAGRVASDMVGAVDRSFSPLPGMAGMTGREGGHAFASGIDATEGQSSAAGMHLRDAANRQFEILRVLSQQAGQWGGQLYAQGIRDRIDWVVRAATDARSAAHNVLSQTAWASDSGLRTMQAYAQGINRGAAAAVAAARNVANQVRRILQATSPPGPESPLHHIDRWGQLTFEAWGDGLLRAIPKIVGDAKAAVSVVEPELGNFHIEPHVRVEPVINNVVPFAGRGAASVHIEVVQHFGKGSVRSDSDIDEIRRAGEDLAHDARLRGLSLVSGKA